MSRDICPLRIRKLTIKTEKPHLVFENGRWSYWVAYTGPQKWSSDAEFWCTRMNRKRLLRATGQLPARVVQALGLSRPVPPKQRPQQ